MPRIAKAGNLPAADVTAPDKREKNAANVAAQANAEFARAPASVRAITQLIVIIVKAPETVRAALVGVLAHKDITTTSAGIVTEKGLFGTTANGVYMQEITGANVRFAKERAMRETVWKAHLTTAFPMFLAQGTAFITSTVHTLSTVPVPPAVVPPAAILRVTVLPIRRLLRPTHRKTTRTRVMNYCLPTST